MRFFTAKSWYVHCSNQTRGGSDTRTVSPRNKPFWKPLAVLRAGDYSGLNAMGFRALPIARAVAIAGLLAGIAQPAYARSEERRVGKECRSGGSAEQRKNRTEVDK